MENNTMKITQSRHIHKNKHISEAFIEVISTYVLQIQKQSSKSAARPLMGGLDMALRILTGSHVTFISERILRRIKGDKLDLNPFELIWEQRHSMGQILVKNTKRSFAVWEHALPIREFRESLIAATNKEEIIHIIYEYPGVAWISREENNELNALGYQRKRPDGFLQCYEEAGITLLNESIYNHKVYNNT